MANNSALIANNTFVDRDDDTSGVDSVNGGRAVHMAKRYRSDCYAEQNKGCNYAFGQDSI